MGEEISHSGTASARPARRSLSLQRARTWSWVLLLTAAAALTGAFVYLTFIGVPGFAKRHIESKLRSHGLDLQLGSVRLSGFQAFLIENASIGKIGGQGPQIRIPFGQALLNLGKVWQPERALAAIAIDDSELTWPAESTNQSVMRNIRGRMKLSPDEWHIQYLHSRLGNLPVEITGRIHNPQSLRNWKRDSKRPVDSAWQARMRQFIAGLNSIRAADGSKLRISFQADASSPVPLNAVLTGNFTNVTTPWADFDELFFTSSAKPSLTHTDAMEGTFQLGIRSARGSWGECDQLQFNASFNTAPKATHLKWNLAIPNLRSPHGTASGLRLAATTARPEQNNRFRTHVSLTADSVQALKVRIQPLALGGDVLHTATPWTTADATWIGQAGRVDSPWGTSQRAEFSARLAPASTAPMLDPTLQTTFWRWLHPLALDWDCRVHDVVSPEIQMEQLSCSGEWRYPILALSAFDARLYGGGLAGTAHLDVVSRELQSRLNSDFDAHQASGILTTNARRWLSQFAWTTPPRASAEARLRLPAWDDPQPNWRREVLPTLALAGNFSGQHGSFRGVTVDFARSDFVLTNLIWRLPNLTISRPEGSASLDYEWHMTNQNFSWHIEGQIDPKALQPLLDRSQRKILDEFAFTAPPRMRGVIQGRWKDRTRLGFTGQIHATNFVFRGEACSSADAFVQFTNRLFLFRDVRIQSNNQSAYCPSASFDPIANHLFVTNATGNLDPQRVAKVIGPRTSAALRPYRFDEPPTITLNGRLPTHARSDADAHFQIKGHSFRYWKFRAPEISGDAYWKGDHLALSNVLATVYGGKLTWDGLFDFSVQHGADFQFRGSVVQADLNTLAADLTGKTNHLEGFLSGHFTVTSARSDQPESWTGFGKVKLRDGFLWNIPIFGALSPLLDKVAPGLGNSRVNSGTANLTLANGRMETKDLELRSPALRLQYAGSIDLSGNVDARVQAEILRDAWAVGRLVSIALWPLTKMFEYRITGTFHQPKSEPLHVPKFFIWPFQPFRTIKELLSQSPEPVPSPANP